VRRSFVIDMLLLATIALLVLGALFELFVPLPRAVGVAAVMGLTFVALASILGRFVTRPDRLRARQSQQTLEIVNRCLPYLREGLDAGTARAVCEIILSESDAVAVAVTNTEEILGFAGLASDHHEIGGPVLTRATREVLATGDHRLLMSKEEIGCEHADCPLMAAIVVPLFSRGRTEGTLKLYYPSPRQLEETHLEMVRVLARLLSTQLELAELDKQAQLATRMELQALQAQINPHFLFNTINTIASLIRTDPPEARRLLREFAAFYRRTLEHSEDLITLGRELAYTHTYLTFEHARFGDRFKIHENVSEAARKIEVPAFIIQPLVENALQHGMRERATLTIWIEADVQDTCMRIRVRDDGQGMAPEVLPHVLEPGFGRGLGIALGNVDDRLRGHFGPESGLSIDSEQGRGTTITMAIALDPSRPDACKI
jgi:two-component system sensor histidine kinase LytS